MQSPVLMCIIFTKTDIMMISRGHTAQQTHRHTHTIIITVIICIRRYLSNFFLHSGTILVFKAAIMYIYKEQSCRHFEVVVRGAVHKLYTMLLFFNGGRIINSKIIKRWSEAESFTIKVNHDYIP